MDDPRKTVCVCGHKREHHDERLRAAIGGNQALCAVIGCDCDRFDERDYCRACEAGEECWRHDRADIGPRWSLEVWLDMQRARDRAALRRGRS